MNAYCYNCEEMVDALWRTSHRETYYDDVGGWWECSQCSSEQIDRDVAGCDSCTQPAVCDDQCATCYIATLNEENATLEDIKALPADWLAMPEFTELLKEMST